MTEPSEPAPTCPNCGAGMLLRTARRGENRGGHFWGCPNYPSCKGTRDVEDARPPEDEPFPDLDERYTDDDLLLTAVPYAKAVHWPAPQGFDDGARLFLSGAGRHEAPQERFREATRWNHACVVLDSATRRALDAGQETVLHVARRILNRGAVVPVDVTPQIPTDREDVVAEASRWHSPDGSAEEVELFCELAPEALGGDGLGLLFPQVPLGLLLRDDQDTVDGLADFVLFNPAEADRAVVIEIDGDQHGEIYQARRDQRRNEALAAAGHRVLRIPASEVRDRTGPNLAVFFEEAQRVRDGLAQFKTEHAATAMLQCQLALIEAIEAGLLQIGTATWRIGLDGEVQPAMQHGVSRFVDLLRALDDLYGESLAPHGVEIRRGCDGASEEVDIVLEWRAVAWSAPAASAAGSASRVHIRPCWLPALAPVPAAPRDWMAPRAEVSTRSLVALLTAVFPRMEAFREGQEVALRRCLQGEDSIVLLPTGAGKSLIYQLASLLLPGLTLVVAPLRSLMQDQVENLRREGIDRALAIVSKEGVSRGQASAERRQLQRVLEQGVHVLCYVSPERLQIQEFRDVLDAILIERPIPLVVIDEAHCVSEWGHDFRPAYLNLSRNARRFGRRGFGEPPALVALTGTASRSVLKDTQAALEIDDLDAVITPTNFDRPELTFEVVRVPASGKERALERVLHFLPRRLGVPEQALYVVQGRDTRCGIVFCPHAGGSFGVTEVAPLVARVLHTRVPAYAGSKLRPGEKEQAARDFKDNRVAVLIATKAYGMGIDKPNIRYTVHYGLPASLESFYQEAGRAGRSRDASHCVVISSVDDYDRAARLLDPSLDNAELLRRIDEIKWSEKDDVTNSLYFYTRAFRGVDEDLGGIRELVEQMRPLEQSATRVIAFRDTAMRERQERVLHRMTALGSIEDYTVDYTAREITLVKRGITAEEAKRRLVKHVAAYSRRRAEQIEIALQSSGSQSTVDGVLRVARELVRFTYDTVAASRREAIRIAMTWAKTGKNDADLRQALLDYLRETEFHRRVTKILEERELDRAAWSDLLAEIVSGSDLREASAALDRASENLPDHPAVLAVRCVLAAWGRDHADRVRELARGAARFFRSRYATSADEMRDWATWLIGEVGRRSPDCLSTVSHALVEQDGALALDLARRDLPALAAAGLFPRLMADLRTEARSALTDGLSTEPYHV